jgi:hypothetical protein
VSRRWYGGDAYSTSYGASINWLRPLDTQSQIEVEGTVIEADYRLNDLQDGTIVDVSVAYDRAFTPALSGRVALRGTRADARDPGYATTSGTIDLIGAARLGRQTLIGQVSYGHLRSDERLALFLRTRREDRVDLTLGLVLGSWRFQGLAPLVRVTQSWNRSTVPLYDFTRTRVEFGFSREF